MVGFLAHEHHQRTRHRRTYLKRGTFGRFDARGPERGRASRPVAIDPAWISAGSGLVGALVGASAALSGKWIDASHARKAEQRRQTNELLVRFWEVADRMWRLSEEIYNAFEALDHFPVGESPAPGERPVSEEDAAGMRQHLAETFRGREEANIEAGILLGRMRLLNLPIAERAVVLRSASDHLHYDRADDTPTKRERALAAYEAEASRFMKS